MATFLLLLIIAFIVWPILRGWLTIRRMRNQARQAWQEARQEADRRQRTARPGGWHAATRPRKHYNATDGEYIDYEEIHIETATASTTSTTDSTTTRAESQIIDAEWEELHNK